MPTSIEIVEMDLERDELVVRAWRDTGEVLVDGTNIGVPARRTGETLEDALRRVVDERAQRVDELEQIRAASPLAVTLRSRRG